MSECQCPDCARVRNHMDHLRKRLRGLEVTARQAPAVEDHSGVLFYLDAEMPLVELH